MSAYDDILHLHEKGVWPNKEIPAWAEKLASKYDCYLTHPVVLCEALMQEVLDLREEAQRVAQWAYHFPSKGKYQAYNPYFDEGSHIDKILKKYI